MVFPCSCDKAVCAACMAPSFGHKSVPRDVYSLLNHLEHGIVANQRRPFLLVFTLC